MTLHRPVLKRPTAEPVSRLVAMQRILSDSQLKADADIAQYRSWLAESQAAHVRTKHVLSTVRFVLWLVTGLWILTILASVVVLSLK